MFKKHLRLAHIYENPIVNDDQRRWFNKGIETARRIVDGYDPPLARYMLSIIPAHTDDVAGDFDTDNFVENLARRIQSDKRLYRPVFDLHKVAVSIFVAASMIDRERDQLAEELGRSRSLKDDITNATDALREIGFDLAGVPYQLHDCHNDKTFEQTGECQHCKNNLITTFQDRLSRDYVTSEFKNIDSGDPLITAESLERLRNHHENLP